MNANKIIVILFSLLSLGFYATAQEFVQPGLEFTCELRVTIDSAMVLGKTAHGERIIIPISGGIFEGPLLKGTVLKGGADYQIADKRNGRTELEAIYTIKTDDNVLIHVRNTGILYIPEEVRKSKPFDFSKVYFRATPKFEAPVNSKYDWLNNAIFICKAVSQKGYVSIQVWKVL
jgi:hypothetical protein